MTITSRVNPLIKHVKRLGADAPYRRSQNAYLCDGRKLLTDAQRSGVTPLTVILAEGVDTPFLPKETQIVTVPTVLMDAISPLESPQGVLFVCPMPEPPPVPPERGRWLLLDRLQDPGNIGSILRTAEAFALDGVLLTPGCADPFNPKSVRAAMGAAFRLPIGTVSFEMLLSGSLPLYAADIADNAVPVDRAEYTNCIVALGNEGQGISPELRRRADKIISIPMRGGAESLGVAAAAAVIVWEMAKG